ncbi:MAG TPA: outer membrane protein transport protein [Polyangia bacterium]|nr:outer membrane protein transport protein [Polyangia bacterium]
MRFVDGRGGTVARAPGALAAVVALVIVVSGAVAAERAARASPIDDPFVGGLTFTGPTSPSIAAIYWNPAALGLVRGTQVMIGGTVRYASTTVTRLDPTTGLPGASASAHDLSQPFQWPLGPGGFLGVSSDLGGDRFTIGFATYMPFVEQTKYALAPAMNEPTRYQALQVDLRNLALVPALSIRFAGDFRVGVAPGFLFSTGRLVFAEDTPLDGLTPASCTGVPCGPEDPRGDARINVSSGNGLGDATFSFTVGGGLYYKHGNLEVGLAYQSRPVGGAVTGVEVAGEQTTVTAPGGAPVTCPTQSTTRCVFGDLAYRLPDVWIGGVTWKLRPGLELSATARWLWLHVHDRIDVRLTGPTLEGAGVPDHIVLYRGFHDVWDLRGRVSYWLRERVRLGAQLRIETSAVDASAVNAAAVDGLTVQPVGLVEARLVRHLWLGAGYGIAFQGQVTANPSVFSPATAMMGCPAQGGDLDACAARNAGQVRPSAAGNYTRVVQDFGLTMTAKF